MNLREAQPQLSPLGPTHTSSIRIRGFSVLVFFRHCMIFPGMAPTYVRLGKRACWAVSACLIHWGPHEHSQAQLPWRSRTSVCHVPSGRKCWPLLARPICRALSHPNHLSQLRFRAGDRFISRSHSDPSPSQHLLSSETQQNQKTGSSQKPAPGTSPTPGAGRE